MARIDPPVLPPRLYRYRKVHSMKLAERELKAIAGGYLWCCRYRALNDPMEGIYGASVWLTEQATFREAVSAIRNEKQSVGICCFSDTYENELMWAHYAVNSSGICVAYSTSRLREGLDDHVHIVRVAYDDREPRIGKADQTCPRQAARKVLSHKKSSWFYEREWRLLTSPEVVQVPGRLQIAVEGAVKTVYLGARMNGQVRTMLEEELTKMNVEVRRMVVSGYRHEWKPLGEADVA